MARDILSFKLRYAKSLQRMSAGDQKNLKMKEITFLPRTSNHIFKGLGEFNRFSLTVLSYSLEKLALLSLVKEVTRSPDRSPDWGLKDLRAVSRLRVLIGNGTKLSKVVLRVVSTVTQFIRAYACRIYVRK